jgi:hypothetical protein
VQKDVVVKPGQRLMVLLKGRARSLRCLHTATVRGGLRQSEQGARAADYWIKREGAEEVLVPEVTRFGEKNKATEEQGWEDVAPGSALEGLLLPNRRGRIIAC